MSIQAELLIRAWLQAGPMRLAVLELPCCSRVTSSGPCRAASGEAITGRVVAVRPSAAALREQPWRRGRLCRGD